MMPVAKRKNLYATVNWIWDWKLKIAHGAKKTVSSAVETTKNSRVKCITIGKNGNKPLNQ